MGIVVMDTATDALGAAVGRWDGTVESAVVQRVLRGHSRLLQPTLQFVLASAGRSMQEIEHIGVGVGPGSYTGVRMGVATAKAMAHALGVPLTCVPTLDAMALAAALGKPRTTEALAETVEETPRSTEIPILAMLFARRHRAFGAWFTHDGERITSRTHAVVQDISAWVSSTPDSVDVNKAQIDGTRPMIVHDLPDAELEAIKVHQEAFEWVHWRNASSQLPVALLRLTVSGAYPMVQGDDLHAVEPDYALPVEAEAKLDSQGKGGNGGDHV